jgi:predicted transcriptional regulator
MVCFAASGRALNRRRNSLTVYRAEHGLSQTGLARLVGMKQPAIARLEAGDHEPSLATLTRLPRTLGVSLTLEIAPQSVVLQSA